MEGDALEGVMGEAVEGLETEVGLGLAEPGGEDVLGGDGEIGGGEARRESGDLRGYWFGGWSTTHCRWAYFGAMRLGISRVKQSPKPPPPPPPRGFFPRGMITCVNFQYQLYCLFVR